MHKLKVVSLYKTIKQSTIVRDISLEVNSGEIVGLLGPNGAGKTTTFYMICGLTSATKGKVLLDDTDMTNMPLSTRAKLGIGYLPQESSVFKDLSVYDNLLMAAEASKIDRVARDERINQLLTVLNISHIRNRKGIQLSGGERRRVEIARSLVPKPKFLLLDEPFAGVDPLAVKDIQSIVRDLVSLDIGVLITDHSVRETLGICNRAYVMAEGTMLASGSSEQIVANEDVKSKYLGDDFSY